MLTKGRAPGGFGRRAGRRLLDVDDDVLPLVDVRGIGSGRHGTRAGFCVDPKARAARRERARYYDLAFDAGRRVATITRRRRSGGWPVTGPEHRGWQANEAESPKLAKRLHRSGRKRCRHMGIDAGRASGVTCPSGSDPRVRSRGQIFRFGEPDPSRRTDSTAPWPSLRSKRLCRIDLDGTPRGGIRGARADHQQQHRRGCEGRRIRWTHTKEL